MQCLPGIIIRAFKPSDECEEKMLFLESLKHVLVTEGCQPKQMRQGIILRLVKHPSFVSFTSYCIRVILVSQALQSTNALGNMYLQ